MKKTNRIAVYDVETDEIPHLGEYLKRYSFSIRGDFESGVEIVEDDQVQGRLVWDGRGSLITNTLTVKTDTRLEKIVDKFIEEKAGA